MNNKQAPGSVRIALISLLMMISFTFSACDALGVLSELMPDAETNAGSSGETKQDTAVMPAPTAVPTQIPIDLNVITFWIEPQFDLEADSPQAEIFRNHVQEFIDQNPGIKVQFRLKDAEGANSLLNSLSITAAAAPDALPTLVLLSRRDLEQAAMQGLIRPIEFYATSFDNNDWYPFAKKIGLYKNEAYGLPMAADVLVLATSNSISTVGYIPLSPPPRQFGQISFAAGDPETLLPYLWYQSAGGRLVDESGQPILERDILLELFTSITENRRVGNFSSSLTQYLSSADTWDAFVGGEIPNTINWANKALLLTDGSRITFIPALGDGPFTYADGWVWCLVQKDTTDLDLNITFMQHMASPDFLAKWTVATDLLPVRPSSIEGMDGDHIFLDKLLLSADIIPSESVRDASNAFLVDEMDALLFGEYSAEVAVENVIAKFEEGQTSE